MNVNAGFASTPECVMDVFSMLAQALADAGDASPLETAADLTARVVDRVERDLIERRTPLPDPSPN